jgi:hypothetical protein
MDPGFGRLTVCSTGFTGVDLLHVSKVLGLLGLFDLRGVLNPQLIVCYRSQV